jgi:hypothetical protein
VLVTSLSQTEKALRDTVITKASGEWLTRLSRVYGIPRPVAIPEDDWRAALKAAALGPRGTPGVTFDFLQGVLQTYQLEVACTVDPAQPQRLTAASGTPFTQAHVGTFVRIQLEGEDEDVWPVYWISGPADIATSGGVWVELVRQSTGQWTGANWVSLSGVTNATAQVLAFTLREPTPGTDDPASKITAAVQTWLVIVNLLAAVALGTPPTYLITPAGDARPVGEPYGGHTQEDEFEGGSQVTGPYPPYLTGTSFGGVSTAFDLILVAGAHSEFNQL